MRGAGAGGAVGTGRISGATGGVGGVAWRRRAPTARGRLGALDHAGLRQGDQEQPGLVGGDLRPVQDGLELSPAVDAADERELGRIRRHLLQPQDRVGAEGDVEAGRAIERRLLPRVVVVAADPLEDHRRGRALEPDGAGGGGLARLEHELAVGPGEDLEQLGFELIDERALEVEGGQSAHLHQDLPLLALLFQHARDGLGEDVGGDEPLFEQDLPERFVRHVRAHRHRVAAREGDDLLGRVLEQQQRAGGPLGVEALEQPGEGSALQRPRDRRLRRVGDQVLGASLDVAPLPLLDRIAQAGPLPERLRRGRLLVVGERRLRGRSARRELGQAGHDGGDVERREQVVGGGEPAAGLGAVARAAVGAGDEHDRHRARLGILAQLFGQAEAVAVPEAGAEDDHVGRPHGDAALRPGRLGLGGELEPRFAQRRPDLLLQIDVALHDQNVAGHRPVGSLARAGGEWTMAARGVK